MDDILLMLPGPTTVDPRVLQAMAKDVVNHRGDEFGEIYTETTKLMSKTFQTKNDSYIITGSGTAAMEAAIANTIPRGEKVLNAVAVTADKIEEALEADEDIKAVTVIHNETSTGVAQPIEEIGKVMKNYDALFIVDTVSSLCGDAVDVDKYGIDVCFTGSQKCIDAWAAAEKIDAPTYYLNMIKYRANGNKTPAQTPYTPSVSLIYAMKKALEIVQEEGLDARVARHHNAAAATRAAVKALGLELFPDEDVSSATVTAVKMPEGITDSQLRGTMLDKYGVQLAGGQDHLKGNIIRIGHMGVISYKELAITFTALGLTLKGLGCDVDPGAGVAALANFY